IINRTANNLSSAIFKLF
ncbi:hypothetical protein CP061683_0020B, partial [Chlamydia psittaci 06-1683]